MIRLLIIGLIALTIILFILSKVKPELFHKVKEHSILHSLILIGLTVCSVVSFFSGTFLSVVAKVQLVDAFRYFNIEGTTHSVLVFILAGLVFLIPWAIVVKYVVSFKYLARYIVKKLDLQLIMDIYDFD